MYVERERELFSFTYIYTYSNIFVIYFIYSFRYREVEIISRELIYMSCIFMYIVHIFRERERAHTYMIYSSWLAQNYTSKNIYIYTRIYIYMYIFWIFSDILATSCVVFVQWTHGTHGTHRFDEADVMSVVCAAVACFRRSGHLTTGGFSKCFCWRQWGNEGFDSYIS